MISNLPKWAQPLVKSFVETQSVPGAQAQPAPPEMVDAYQETATALMMVAGQDEKAGVDQALDRPGVVQMQGMTFHFESTPERFQMVASGQQQGVEKVLYASLQRDHFEILGLESGPIINGAVLKRAGQDFEGFLLQGL